MDSRHVGDPLRETSVQEGLINAPFLSVSSTVISPAELLSDSSPGGQNPPRAPVLHVECVGFPLRVVVMVQGADDEAVAALAPLVRWLRRQRTWRRGGWVEILVNSPEAVAHAFGAPGTIQSYQDLEMRAGLVWFLPPEWRDGVLHLIEWQAHIKTRLGHELRRRVARAAGS